MANIRKRNKSYEITVSCGYGIDGRQIRRTMTYTPEKGMTAKQIEKEVQRQAVLFEEQCRDGVVGTDGRMKLADYVPIYLENAKHRLSPVVYEKYCRMLDICIVPMLGHFKLKDIKPIHIQRFVNALEERTTHLDGKQGRLTPSTIRRYYTMVQSVLHSIDFPVLYGYNVVKKGPYGMSIFAGPKLRYLWGKKNEITFSNFDQKGIHEKLYPFNISAVIGVGVNISRIFFDFRYEQGIGNISKSITYDNINSDGSTGISRIIFDRRDSALSFSLGFIF